MNLCQDVLHDLLIQRASTRV